MHVIVCTICMAYLDGKIYYTLSEIAKYVPGERTKRVYFSDEQTEIGIENTGWVNYVDIHICEKCIQKPLDLERYLKDDK